MEHIGGRGRSDATLYNYQRYIDREIKPIFGPTRLSKLTVLDLDRFYGRLSKRGLAPATVRQIHAVIRASLNQGERWGLVGRNVARLASAPSQPQREQHPPSVDDVHLLLAASAAIDPMFGLYARFVVATGVRRAEACGVRWSDVDFDAGSVSISRSYLALPNGVKGDRPTKTRSARVITLDPDTVLALRLRSTRPCVLLGCRRSTSRCGSRDTCSRSTPKAPRRGDPTRSTRGGIVRVKLLGCARRSACMTSPLAGDATPRRWRPRPDGRGTIGPRGWDDHAEGLRAPHKACRRASGRGHSGDLEAKSLTTPHRFGVRQQQVGECDELRFVWRDSFEPRSNGKGGDRR